MAKNDKGNTTATPPDLPLSREEQGAFASALAAAITHDSTGSGDEQGAVPSTSSGRTEICVAYHAGPGEIGFCGNHWKRGEAQTITLAEWHAMQARGDFNEFNFEEEEQ